jgi:YfiH family protein
MSDFARSVPMSSVSTTDEIRIAGTIPRWEIPGWRDRFGVEAGITGRASPEEEAFDLGLWSDRPVRLAMADWRQFRRSFPAFPSVALAHQVHGNRVLWHVQPGSGWIIAEGADGHATRDAGLLLTITVADCVPLYLIAPEKGVIALLHAGWRGAAAGVLTSALMQLESKAGVRPGDIVLHAGVAISGARYQVGQEVFAALGLPTPRDRGQLDLRSVLAEQALALGVGEVSVSGHCTAGEPESFYSHRGSGGAPGRMVAWLGWPAIPGAGEGAG